MIFTENTFAKVMFCEGEDWFRHMTRIIPSDPCNDPAFLALVIFNFLKYLFYFM